MDKRKTITVAFTPAEYEQVMLAIGEMTDANGRDIDEMMLCGMTRKEIRDLLSAEAKLRSAHG